MRRLIKLNFYLCAIDFMLDWYWKTNFSPDHKERRYQKLKLLRANISEEIQSEEHEDPIPNIGEPIIPTEGEKS